MEHSLNELLLNQLKADFTLAERAVLILQKSCVKCRALLAQVPSRELSDDEREALESLTSRYGRALDFLTQRLLRTIDKIELTDDGSVLDRVNRFKKRGILRDDVNYGVLKDLRNQIVHEYIIDETDKVVADVLAYSPYVVEIYNKAKDYCKSRGFLA